MNEIVSRTTLSEIVAFRNAAIAKMRTAANTIEAGHKLANDALELAKSAHKGTCFNLNDRTQQDAYANLFKTFTANDSFELYRKQCDARIWMYLINVTGMTAIMDKTAKDTLYQDLSAEVPKVTEENVYALFEELRGDAELIFQRGLARAFGDLDRRFKSHDAFKLGSRIILTNVFDSWGGWNFHSRMGDTMVDIERVFAVLDKQKPNPQGLCQAIHESRKGSVNPRQSVTETAYFKIKGYKNGNAHLWFKQDDLVTEANKVLAAYYGAVLPDAAPHPDVVTPEDLKSKTGAVSTKLQFYPTPDAVTRHALGSLYFTEDMTVLEPSAGTGNMVRYLLKHTKARHIHAIEVNQQRANNIPRSGRTTVTCANFLTQMATPSYDHVVMNPPFYGTHWMQHVMHAFDYLKPGGTLTAILPITAELGGTSKHVTFRKWAKNYIRWGCLFTDLPAESFVSSGTRVNTVSMTLHNKR